MERKRLSVEKIRDELEALEPMRAALKARAMLYQVDLKEEVARHLGVSFEEVDLPYEEWAKIRDAYLKQRDHERKVL